MDYFDRNGNKWSIDKGDWLGHQAKSDELTKSRSVNFSNKKLLLLILTIAILVTCLITFV